MEEDPTGQAEAFVYDLGTRASLVMRELVPEMHTSGPQKCYREKATDDFTGWTIWAAATLLARWIIAKPEMFAGKDVIELGAGCGVTGLATACCTSAKSVVLNDYQEPVMQNLLYNVARNATRDASAPPIPATPASVSSGDSAISAQVGDETYTLRDTFRTSTGCAVTLSQMDWDNPDTWPRRQEPSGASSDSDDGEAPPAYAQYDVVICADLFYRRSYSRKVASAVRALLRPGGVVLIATPTAREGLSTLDTMMASAGFGAEEAPFPPEWRVNPLRAPHCASDELLRGLGLARLGLRPDPSSEWEAQLRAQAEAHSARTEASEGDDDGDLVVPLVSATTGAPACPLHFVGTARAKGMFPELFVPSYGIVSIVYRKPQQQPEGEDGESSEA